MPKIDLIAGTRPNFVKIASLINAIESSDKSFEYRLVHTGQHYDASLSESFFKDLELPEPDFNFGIGSGSQAEQTAGIMLNYEKLLRKNLPDLCLVVGDVNSTMACAITAKKMGVKVAHVEGGIRSNDLKMPEEINRIVTDSIADYFFTTTTSASRNLVNSGHSQESIFFVGNTMIDTLKRFENKFRRPGIWSELSLRPQEYFVLTMHRPANVDEKETLKSFLTEIINHSEDKKIIFPIHPRTSKTLDLDEIINSNLHIIPPLGYLDFNYLVKNSLGVITDSGGITEETTAMNVPCITLRDNTERPETVEIGTNDLIGTNPKNIAPAIKKILTNNWKKGQLPDKWDGKSGERIISILQEILVE
ncbi:non-hydrolyzing UDP-N-acetylglucosamine 2-epimerase [Christiangramia echinicola]|uniref:UDP-N-acetylglucosamine 2-epimerase (Non-hydrolysing) n=1 Tax=Christiangramia echinicola TaxID=279359 RepID=A0A1H1L3B4_9FLAO|nr:UDP-N-acetylglucosamine 2-epimerase (non-hydrolyzing) [Christiangramia echinicola]SDR69071.1 UDP-N-acetylglucosamine 2-epimerase (non-hydrolysing) [Christiangramia echinicola]